MDELLVKYLLGEADEGEKRKAEQWIQAGPENQRHFRQLQLIWEESKRVEAQSTTDVAEAWQRLQQRIQKDTASLSLMHRRSRWRIAAAAALVIVLAAASGTFFFSQRQITIAARSQVRTDTLPDGSVVTLNRQATLSWSRNFNKKIRRVDLKGEAFFLVAPDKAKPFIIKAGEAYIQVVGTSFNVKQTDAHTEIIVETGIVTVAKKAKSVRLLPHQKAIVFRNRDTPLVEKNRDELYNYYRTHTFTCNNTPLWELVAVLNEAYNAHIAIADSTIRNVPLTTTFKNESLENILAILTQTLGIHRYDANGQIILQQADKAQNGK